MSGNATAIIHVVCSAPKEGQEGLDSRDGRIWLSWTCAGKKDSAGKEDKKSSMVSIPVWARNEHNGAGHDALNIAETLTIELKSQWGKLVSATEAQQIGISTTVIDNPALKANPALGRAAHKPTKETYAKIDFVNVNEIDAASCHGKIEIYLSGQININKEHPYDQTHPTDPPVKRTPVAVALKEKRTEKVAPDCPGVREPKDPPPRDAPEDYPATTPGSDWKPLYSAAVTTVSEPSSKPEGGTDPGEKKILRPIPQPPIVPGMGIIRLGIGSALDAADLTWRDIPWLIDYESPRSQLYSIGECISIAGIECYLFEHRLYISHDRALGLPVIAFEIRTNLSGKAFPWHWVIGLWPPKSDPREPEFIEPLSTKVTVVHGAVGATRADAPSGSGQLGNLVAPATGAPAMGTLIPISHGMPGGLVGPVAPAHQPNVVTLSPEPDAPFSGPTR